MTTKRDRALAEYTGHKGQATLAHVERNVSQAYPTALDDLTGVQYGRLLNVANQSFHDGRASTGADIEGDVLVIKNCALIPVSLLRAIKAVERTESTYRSTAGIVAALPSGRYTQDGTPNPDGEYYREQWHITDYYIGDILIYTERC